MYQLNNEVKQIKAENDSELVTVLRQQAAANEQSQISPVSRAVMIRTQKPIIINKLELRHAAVDYDSNQICETPEFKFGKIPYQQYKKKAKEQGFSDGTVTSYHNQEQGKFLSSRDDSEPYEISEKQSEVSL